MSEVINLEVGGSYTLPPAGNQAAVCVGLTIVGTIEETFEGHKKMTKKLILSFELVNTNHTFDEKKGPEPFVMHKEFTASFNSKAKLRKLISDWTGKKFTDEQAKNINISDVVGKGCFANVVIDKNSKGEDRAEILSIAQVPDGVAIPAPRIPLRVFNVDKQPFNTLVFNSLPQWIQKKIQSSDEYKKLNPGAVTSATATVLDSNPFASGGTVTSENAAKLF